MAVRRRTSTDLLTVPQSFRPVWMQVNVREKDVQQRLTRSPGHKHLLAGGRKPGTVKTVGISARHRLCTRQYPSSSVAPAIGRFGAAGCCG